MIFEMGMSAFLISINRPFSKCFEKALDSILQIR